MMQRKRLGPKTYSKWCLRKCSAGYFLSTSAAWQLLQRKETGEEILQGKKQLYF